MISWIEIYEHAVHGEIALSWQGEEPNRSHLIAIQCDLWTPRSEVDDCLQWAREQERSTGGSSPMESADAALPEMRSPNN